MESRRGGGRYDERNERGRERNDERKKSERVSQRGWTSVDQRRGVIEYEHAHGPITLLAGNPRCAVLRVIGYMMYDQRVDTARVQRQRGRRREQHTVCVTSAEGLDASSVCSLVTVVLEPTRCFSGPRADVLLTALARLSLNTHVVHATALL